MWGAGRDIWWRMDQFHFIAQPVGATASLSAQVLAQTRTHPWAKVGLMLRDSSSAGAPYVDILVTPNRGIVVQYRLRPFAWAWQKGWLLLGKAPVYLRLTRNGDVVSAAVSRDGRAWVTITVMTVPLQPTALLGVAITSHQPDALSIATLRGVTLTS